MGSDVNGSVLGKLEGVLSEQGWAGLVSAGHQRPAISRNLDKRIPDVGPALGVQPKIAQDPLVGPATTEETGPNEAGRVDRRGRSGRHGRQCVLTIHALDESAAVTVRVVVRQLEMAIGAHLQGDLTEDVRRRNPTVRRAQGAGIEGVGVPEDVLETRRAGVADADTDRVGAAGGVRDQWSGIGDYAVLHVEAQEVVCAVAHDRTADRPPVLPGGEIPRWVSDRIPADQG